MLARTARKKRQRIPLTLESRLDLVEMTVRREAGRPPVIGSAAARAFIEVDEVTIDAIDTIRASRNLRSAERKLLKRYGEAYDLVALGRTLLLAGLVARVDGEPVPLEKTTDEKHRFLNRILPEQVAWARSNLVWALAIALGVAWIVIVSVDPWATVGGEDAVAIPGYPGASALFLVALALFVTYLHELGHFVAARSYGVDATIGWNVRFGLLFLITDVTNGWHLPRRAQLRIFLAGIAVNASLGGGAMLLAEMSHEGMIHGISALVPALRFLALLNYVPILFQFFILARTDLYFVLGVVFGERRLKDDSFAYLRMRAAHTWARLRGRGLVACGTCSARVLADAPYCLACGHARAPRDPNRYPCRYERRHAHLVFGTFFLIALAPAYFLGWNLLVHVKNLVTSTGFVAMRAAWNDGSILHLVDAVILLGILSLQAAYLLSKLPRRLWRLGRRARRAWLRATRAGAAEDARRAAVGTDEP